MILFHIRNRKIRYLSDDGISCCDCVNCLHIKNTGRRKSPDKKKNVKYFNSDNLAGSFTSCVSDSYRYSKEFDNSRTHIASSSRKESINNSNKSIDDVSSHMWLYMVVWIASVLSYINGLTADFVHDDLSAITSNPDVTGRNPLYQVFLNDYWGRPLSHPLSHKSYRPLTILTFR